jgi:hypothetical protein
MNFENVPLAIKEEYGRLQKSIPAADWYEPAKIEVFEPWGGCAASFIWEFGSKRMLVYMFQLCTVDVTVQIEKDQQVLFDGLLADSFSTYWKWLWEVSEF